MAQSGTGTANFSKAISDWLTNDVGESTLNFDKNDSFVEFINKWADIWRKSLETAKKKKGTGHIASGELYQSLLDGWQITTLGQRINIQLVLPEYYSATDTGRKPTTSGGSGALRKALAFDTGKAGGWIAQRKLVPSSGMEIKGKYKLKDGTVKTYTRKLTAAQANKALSFAISKKIHENGFEGTRWFSKHLKKFETELAVEVEDLFGKGAKFNLEIFGK